MRKSCGSYFQVVLFRCTGVWLDVKKEKQRRRGGGENKKNDLFVGEVTFRSLPIVPGRGYRITAS